MSTSEPRRCESCKQVYPNVSGIQCLIRDPAGFVRAALDRVTSYRLVTSERAQALLLEARGSQVSEKTRRRLERLANGLLAEGQCLEILFMPLRETLAAHPSPLGALASLLDDPGTAAQYWEHVFRDWVWGEAENARTRGLLQPYLGEPIGVLAVFGAGTARLAFDLSQHPLIDEVVALDTNPLPFLVADRLLSGSTVELVEFPLVPLTIDHVAIPRRIEPPPAASSKLSLVFADALQAPFADGALDAVVTPWFIDAVAAELSEVTAEINRVLRPGGLWLNVGPLYYSGSPFHAYSFEEVCELVRASGFELLGQHAEALPYFDSPVSGTCRNDRTYVFAARKVAPAPPVAARARAAPWLDNPTLPVPVSATLAASVQRSVVTAGIGQLVDGARSLSDITRILSESWGVPPDVLLPKIQAFLSRNTEL